MSSIFFFIVNSKRLFLFFAICVKWNWPYCLPLKSSLLPCPIFLLVCSEPAVREGGADDGVVLSAFGHPDERGQVPSFCQGPTQELLCHCNVHCSAASASMFCLQVCNNKLKSSALTAGTHYFNHCCLPFLISNYVMSNCIFLST